MTPTFLFLMGVYAVAGFVLMCVVVGCFWDGWRS